MLRVSHKLCTSQCHVLSSTFVSNFLHCLLNKAQDSQAVMIILSAQLLHVAERNLEIIPKLRECIRVVIR